MRAWARCQTSARATAGDRATQRQMPPPPTGRTLRNRPCRGPWPRDRAAHVSCAGRSEVTELAGDLPRAGRFAALAAPAYRRYWYGSVASVGGSQLMMIGQSWLVYRLSGSTLDLGLLGAASAIPNILMSLFGGALADQLDKRLVLMATALVSTALLCVLAALDFTGVVRVWHVLVIAALYSLVSGLDFPTRQALFPHLINRAHMMSAVALNSIVWQSTRMIMPALGGVLLRFSSTWLLFLLAAIGALSMYFVMQPLRVAVPVRTNSSTLGQIAEGISFISGDRLFAALIGLTFMSMLFGSSYLQLMPAFAKLLGSGATGFGALMSATGVGSVLGTLLATGFQHTRRLGWLLLSAAAAAAVLIIGFALITAAAPVLPFEYTLAMVCAMVGSLASSVYLISSMTVLQLAVPDELRGRVMGIHGISYSFMSLGALFIGALANSTSAPFASGLSAMILLLFIVWLTSARPVIRDIDGTQQRTAFAG